MKTDVVLDASVAYKWIIDEGGPTQQTALKLRKEFLIGKIKVIAPDIVLYEI